VATASGNPAQSEAATTTTSTIATPSMFTAYRVIADAGPQLNPSLQSLDPKELIQKLSQKGGALWLGEHHNSAKDHVMQQYVLTSLKEARQLQRKQNDAPIGLGLEMIEQKFEQVLEDYGNGKLSINELRKQVEWDTRWTWPFDLYAPIFETARSMGVQLVALNVNTEDLAFVERSGLPGLPKDRMRAYIADSTGFAQFALTRQFSTYVDYVIRPSYDMHRDLGLLKYSRNGQPLEEEMTFRNFFSGRILWDEAMASCAATWVKRNPNGLLIGLVGADHVKFGNGIPGRFSRIMSSSNNVTPTTSCTSILLNPTLIDSRPPGSVRMEGVESNRPDSFTLQLRYLKDSVEPDSPDRFLATSTGGVMPIADYVLFG
jgi:uncharacterized iron-regulated protein